MGDNWTDVFEPVRRRPHFVFGLWRNLQTVQEASFAIGTFLRERPDLRASLRDRPAWRVSTPA